MPFLASSQYTGDMIRVPSNLDLAHGLYGTEGASRVTGLIALTGQATSLFTLSTIWDSADAHPILQMVADVVFSECEVIA